jgi:copper chaperone
MSCGPLRASLDQTDHPVLERNPMQTLTYSVPGVSCGHCRTAITDEVTRLGGVAAVDVDLERKLVSVTGAEIDDGAIRDAIDEAGYDIA